MHGSIRDRLEDLLAARGAADAESARHLANCDECSSELDAMKDGADMLHTLRAPELIEPEAGFYSRVMQRIEETTKDSIWAVFIYSPFGKRLAYASLMIAVMLGTYVVTQESRDGDLTRGAIASSVHYDAPVYGTETQAQQRDAVLENFASHRLASQQGSLQ